MGRLCDVALAIGWSQSLEISTPYGPTRDESTWFHQEGFLPIPRCDVAVLRN